MVASRCNGWLKTSSFYGCIKQSSPAAAGLLGLWQLLSSLVVFAGGFDEGVGPCGDWVLSIGSKRQVLE